VGDSPTTINANSVLEMESTNKGMLLPRIALSSTTSASPLTAFVAGMTVYNTATAGDVTPGYYYSDGTKWVKMADAAGTDATIDAWVNDATNSVVKLGTKSDASTARSSDNAIAIGDDGFIYQGMEFSPSFMSYPSGLITQGGEFRQKVTRTDAGTPTVTYNSIGQTGISVSLKTGGSPYLSPVLNLGYTDETAGYSGANRMYLTKFGSAATLPASIKNRTFLAVVTGGTQVGGMSIEENGAFRFYTGAAGDLVTNYTSPRVIITETGNFGIGTASPLAKLDLAGYLKLGSSDGTADAGTAANREGDVRYTTAGGLQYHDASNWVSVAGISGSKSADMTLDAWENDPAKALVKLGTKSDASTARSSDNAIAIGDDGFIYQGMESIPSFMSYPSGLITQGGEFRQKVTRTDAGTPTVTYNSIGQTGVAVNVKTGGNQYLSPTLNLGFTDETAGYSGANRVYLTKYGSAATLPASVKNRTILAVNTGGTQVGGMSIEENGAFRFYTGTAGDLITNYTSPRVIITETGRVGIGTTTPNGPLDVLNFTSAAPVRFGESATGAGIQFDNRVATTAPLPSDNSAHIGWLESTSGYLGGSLLLASRPNVASSIVLNTQGTDKMIITASGNVGVATTSPQATFHVGGTGAIIVPVGDNATRPSTPVQGMIRYNTTAGKFEGYDGTSWVLLH
jgi:hypothetical protein